MFAYTQNQTDSNQRIVPAFLRDPDDGTPETGEDGGQPQISINGGAFASTSDTLHTLGNGAYYITLTAAELATLGVIHIRYKSANTEEFQFAAQVVTAVNVSNEKLQSYLLHLIGGVGRLEQMLKVNAEGAAGDIPHEEFIS